MWIQWLMALLAAIGSFLGAHPFPHQQRVAARLVRRGAIVQQYLPTQMVSLIGLQGGQPILADMVIDTHTQVEGGKPTTYEWKARASEPAVLLLFRDGVQVGGWHAASRLYQDYDARLNAWATICTGRTCVPVYKDCPPVPLPNEVKPTVGQAASEPKTGVDNEKLKDYGKGNTRKGKNITREESFAALSKTIPDDSAYLRICCIGNCNADKLKADLTGPLAGEKVTVQSYASNEEPILKGLGFYEKGVHVLSPTGTPLYWCAQYGDPEDMKKGIEVAQAREKDPRWDPAHWPPLEQLPPTAPTPAPAPAPAPSPAPTPDAPAGQTPWWQPFAALVLAWIVREVLPYLASAIANGIKQKPAGLSEADIVALVKAMKADQKPA